MREDDSCPGCLSLFPSVAMAKEASKLRWLVALRSTDSRVTYRCCNALERSNASVVARFTFMHAGQAIACKLWFLPYSDWPLPFFTHKSMVTLTRYSAKHGDSSTDTELWRIHSSWNKRRLISVARFHLARSLSRVYVHTERKEEREKKRYVRHSLQGISIRVGRSVVYK